MVERFSINELSTLPASFAEDVAAYEQAGVAGIGIIETKLERDSLKVLRDSGLVATHCLPAMPAILPLPKMDLPVEQGPSDPEARVAAICASVRRFAAFEPVCVIIGTGPRGERDEDEARGVVRESLAAIAATGEAVGVAVALEPIHPSQPIYSFVHTFEDALDLIGDEKIGILLDTWHISDPDVIRANVERVIGVHVADRREPTRSNFDRVLLGDGVLDLIGAFRALEEGGYEGWYDLEVFSDNGMFGENFPDSLWDLDPVEFARRARASFERVWERL